MWDKKAGWQASSPHPATVPAFSIDAGPDIVAVAGVPVYLDGALNPGSFTPSRVALAWSLGPAATTFTTANYQDANATFPVPGVYVLRLTGTAPGPVTVTDTMTVVVEESYAAWAARVMASQSAANRLPLADPDLDGASNVVEFVLNGNPLNAAITGFPQIASINGLLSITWQRNKFADSAIQIIPQLSTNLTTWEAGPDVLDSFVTGSTATTESWRATESGTPGARTRASIRLLVIMP